MLKNLKIEWLKIKYYKAFWIFMGLYLISIIAINNIAFYIYQQTVKEMPMADALLNNPYSFPKVWQTVGWTGSWLLYFPGIIMILLASNEFSFKTHRQNIIDGWSRNEFVYTKILLTVCFALTTTIITTITAISVGFASGSDFSMDGLANIIYIFLQSLSYISLALLLSILFRRSGVALIVFFLYGLIFETIIYGLLNRYVNNQLGYFMPLQPTDVLIPLPFGDKIFYKNVPGAVTLVITTLVYLSLYWLFIIRKFQKDDL